MLVMALKLDFKTTLSCRSHSRSTSAVYFGHAGSTARTEFENVDGGSGTGRGSRQWLGIQRAGCRLGRGEERRQAIARASRIKPS